MTVDLEPWSDCHQPTFTPAPDWSQPKNSTQKNRLEMLATVALVWVKGREGGRVGGWVERADRLANTHHTG